jgi:hypothetical protein
VSQASPRQGVLEKKRQRVVIDTKQHVPSLIASLPGVSRTAPIFRIPCKIYTAGIGAVHEKARDVKQAHFLDVYALAGPSFEEGRRPAERQIESDKSESRSNLSYTKVPTELEDLSRL